MKSLVLILAVVLWADVYSDSPASARLCNSPALWQACDRRPPPPTFTEPRARRHSLTSGVTYGWIEDYAYFYERPEPGARHVRTATTGMFYGPVAETAIDANGDTWYHVWDNWLPGRYFHIVEASTFAGMEVNNQPQRPFGWVLRPFQPRLGPGARAIDGLAELQRYDFVQVYGSALGPDGRTWYDLGPLGWVRYNEVALIAARARPRAVGPDEYWVDVDLSQQTIAAYEGDRMVYAALISSGLSQWATRVGLNQVWERRLSAPMRGGVIGADYYYLDGVLHTLYFDGAISLHNAYWHDDFGRPKSHGCVNLAPRVAEWIYYWSEEAPNALWVWTHYSSRTEFTQ